MLVGSLQRSACLPNMLELTYGGWEIGSSSSRLPPLPPPQSPGVGGRIGEGALELVLFSQKATGYITLAFSSGLSSKLTYNKL